MFNVFNADVMRSIDEGFRIGAIAKFSCFFFCNISMTHVFSLVSLQNEITYDVSESASVGFVLGQLLATDEDSGPDADFEFLLVADSNNQGFTLGRSSGQLVVAQELDRESVETIVLTALVKNPGPVRGMYSTSTKGPVKETRSSSKNTVFFTTFYSINDVYLTTKMFK